MNANFNPESGDGLLKAVLRDDNWRAINDAMKAEALGAFRARQRLRRLVRWASTATALVAVAACGVHWLSRPSAAPRLMAAKPLESPGKSGKLRYLTDEELVASFPEGSCILAEIDGKKELLFLDRNIERQYVSDAGQERSSQP